MEKKRDFKFELKIGFILLIVIAMVSITGSIAYYRFSNLVNNFTQASRPDYRIVSAQSLLNQLTELENNAKTYNLTNDTIYLERFYKATFSINDQLNILTELNKDKSNKIDITKVDSLIAQKIEVLNELLILQNKFRAAAALDKIENRLEKTNVNDLDSIGSEQTKRRFFNWFKPKEKAVKQDSSLSIEQLTTEIKKIKSEETGIESRLKQDELSLIVRDRELTKTLNSIVDDFNDREKKELVILAANAKKEANSTNFLIAVFCVSAGVLLLFVVYLIVRYVQKNNAYKIVLKKAQLEAEQTSKSRAQFLANMSHEIRTPMNSIAGFADLLGKSELNNDQKDHVEMIQKSSEHLTYLINDVLDFSKLQNGKLKFESVPFYPVEIFEEIVEYTKQLVSNKNVIIESNFNFKKEPIEGDPFRFRQILLNIASNASKFTQEGFIRYDLALINNAMMEIVISDSGIGMTEETQARIFNEFEQESSSTAKDYGGTGLGLAITQKLIEILNGTIRVNSQKGKGTEFIIQIPVSFANTAQHVADRSELNSANESLKPLNILIVDDVAFNRKLLNSILKSQNHTLVEAENGAIALEYFDKTDFDLILTDIRMPILDGTELIKEIRKQNKSVKIIVLSAAINDDEIKSYLEIGADSFLSKPFKEIELTNTINQLFNIEISISSNKEAMETNSISHCNLDQLKSISANDVSFYKEMLVTFNETTKSGIEMIEVALTNEDFEMVANQAHKISSPCKHLGAIQLYEQLKTIEKLSRLDGNEKEIQKLIKSMKQEADCVISEINSELINSK